MGKGIEHIHSREEIMDKIESMLTDSDDRMVAEIAAMLSEMSVTALADGTFKVIE